MWDGRMLSSIIERQFEASLERVPHGSEEEGKGQGRSWRTRCLGATLYVSTSPPRNVVRYTDSSIGFIHCILYCCIALFPLIWFYG